MRIISVTSGGLAFGNKGAAIKKISRATLPVTSGLGLLAGSSLGGGMKPPNAAPHEPGTSVDDSFWEQIKHTGKMAKDAGEEIANGAVIGSVLGPVGAGVGAGIGYFGTLLGWGAIRNSIVDGIMDD